MRTESGWRSARCLRAWPVRVQQTAAATMIWLIRILATDTSVWHDDVWVIDSTPIECGPPVALSAGHRRSRRDCAHRPAATASAVLAWRAVATGSAGASGA
jgi:hypothetical protein